MKVTVSSVAGAVALSAIALSASQSPAPPAPAAQSSAAAQPPAAARPLRVYIHAGLKTHAEGQHDYPQFLADWSTLLMNRGAIVEEGRTENVLQPPWHPYTEALLSAIPEVDRAPDAKRIRLRGDTVERDEAVKGCRFQHRCPRKVGAICETETPPVRMPAAGHRIACHIPFQESP